MCNAYSMYTYFFVSPGSLENTMPSVNFYHSAYMMCKLVYTRFQCLHYTTCSIYGFSDGANLLSSSPGCYAERSENNPD